MDFQTLLEFLDDRVFNTAKRHLKDLEIIVLQGSWDGSSYEKIAQVSGYTDKYLKQDVGPKLWKLLSEALGEKVSKTNFQSALERQYRAAVATHAMPVANSDLSHSAQSIAAIDLSSRPLHSASQDWGDAPDITFFCGRDQELNTLENWIQRDRCRLIALLGMGGIGKTTLAVKLADRVQHEFDYLIWRSLRNTPSLPEMLLDFIQCLSNQQEVKLPENLNAQLLKLLSYLRERRCLLILDNVESIFQEGDRIGRYREGCEAYGELFATIGATHHQSCLILTSREKPREITQREGERALIRSLPLHGLAKTAAQEVVQYRGQVTGSIPEWSELVDHYAGNPLALKIAAPAIQDFFGGNLTQFLKYVHQGSLVFDDIRDVLKRQFDRLSAIEQAVMFWLAIDREPATVSELQADLVHTAAENILDVIASLQRRSLIETTSDGTTQQPVVMEYVTTVFVQQCFQELMDQNLHLLRSHAVMKAQATGYVREAQIRAIVAPLTDRLLNAMHSVVSVEFLLGQILESLRDKPPHYTGYAAGNLINLLAHLQPDLSDRDFSNLAISQAYLPNVTLHRTNFNQAILSKTVFAETISSVTSLAFHSDNSLLVTGESNGEIRLWNVSTGTQLTAWKGHVHWVSAVLFSPNGELLATSSYDQTIRLWDAETQQCLKVLEGHSNWVREIIFSLDGQQLVSVGNDNTAKIWDVSTGDCLRTLTGHTNLIWALALSPDGRLLSTASYDCTVRVWDLHTGVCLNVLEGHADIITVVAFSADGRSLISGGRDKALKSWDVATGTCLMTTALASDDQLLAVAINPDRTLLATAGFDQTLQFWEIATQACVRSMPNAGCILAIAFNADSTLCATGGDDQTIRIWNVATGRNSLTLQGYKDGVMTAVFAPGTQQIVSGHCDTVIRLWNIQTGTIDRELRGHTGRIWLVDCHPHQPIVASGSSDQTIRLWHLETGECLQVLRGNNNWVWSVAFSPDGGLLASGDGNNQVKIWDLANGECLKTLSGHQSRVWSIGFSPDGKVLVSGSQEHLVRLWDVATGEWIGDLADADYPVWSATFSPDGRYLACSGSNQVVSLWDVQTRKCLRVLTGHTRQIWRVAFSPDGQRLMSGSDDQTARIWDLETGDCLHILAGHTSAIGSVAFNADGSMATTGCSDGTIALWDAATGNRLLQLRSPRPFEQMQITGVGGLTTAQKETLKALGAVERE